jgi:hypothetical protein
MVKDDNVQFADFEDTTDEYSWLIRVWTSLFHNIIEIIGVIHDTDDIVGIVHDTDDIVGIVKESEDIKGAIGKGTM